VLAFKSKEKIIIEILSEEIITKGILLLFPSSALLHSTIGKSGKTHGASTVRTQAKNAVIRSIINIYLLLI